MVRGVFLRLAQKLSPIAWLLVILLSLFLGMASTWTLYNHLNDRGKDRMVLYYESVGRFIQDTIRLTFMRPEASVAPEISDAVRIAPLNLLNPEASFNWVSTYQDVVTAPQADELPPPVAPIRLLDPNWHPL